MLADRGAQSPVEEVSGCVVAADVRLPGLVGPARDDVAGTDPALRYPSEVHEQPFGPLGVRDAELQSISAQDALVADFTARFAVEGRAV